MHCGDDLISKGEGIKDQAWIYLEMSLIGLWYKKIIKVKISWKQNKRKELELSASYMIEWWSLNQNYCDFKQEESNRIKNRY